MLRRVILVLCLCASAVPAGCGEAKSTNPANLEYGTDPPPKRGGVQPQQK